MTMDIVFNWGDPIIGVHRTYLSINIKPIVWTNTQSYSNPKVDELLNTAGGVLDPTAAQGLVRDVPEDRHRRAAGRFINVMPYHTAASKKLGNVPASIWGPLAPYDEVYLK